MKKTTLFIISSILSLFSCDYINNKGDEYLLARIDNEVLYRQEVYANIPNITSNKDSTQLVHSYVDNWVKKKLMEKEVFNNDDFDESSIKKQLKEIKYQLALHQYRTSYLIKNLDSTISDAAIKEYYKNHQEDFQLRSAIVKATYTKLPTEAPNIKDVKSMISSNDPHEKNEFKDYCYQFALNYHLNDSIWVPMRDLLEATPFESSLGTEIQFLKKNKSLAVVSDNEHHYFLKIKEYRLKNEISPFEFVESRIKNILLNKKRTELIDSMEKGIYSKASKDKAFEVFY